MFQQSQVPLFIIVLAEDTLKMEEKIFQDMNTLAHIKVVHINQVQQELGVA